MRISLIFSPTKIQNGREDHNKCSSYIIPSAIYFLFSYQGIKKIFKYYSSDKKVCHTNYFSKCPMGTYYMMHDDVIQVINLKQGRGKVVLLVFLKRRISVFMGYFVPHPSSWYLYIESFRNEQRNRKLLLIHLQQRSE